MTVDEVIAELGVLFGYTRQIAEDDPLFEKRWHLRSHPSKAEFGLAIERWTHSTALSKLDLLNQIAANVAVEFHEGRLSWPFGDMVVNELVEFYREMGRGELSGDVFWDVFCAFDIGESGDVDQTESAIAEVVAKLRDRYR